MISETLKDAVIDVLGRLKRWGMVVGIIMIVLGIFMFVKPIATTAVFIWILIIGLIIKGISDIVLYCKMPVGAKDGSHLALGIIWLVLGGFFVFSAIDEESSTTLFAAVGFQSFMGILMGVTILFNGISLIVGSAAMGEGAGWGIAGGILMILLSFFMLASPFISGITLTVVYGIFLCVSGISVFCRALSM